MITWWDGQINKNILLMWRVKRIKHPRFHTVLISLVVLTTFHRIGSMETVASLNCGNIGRSTITKLKCLFSNCVAEII